MEKENTDSSRIEIVALIRKIAILLYRKPAKPLATTVAMRNKAVLLFVYWNFWINSRKRTKKTACGRTTDGKNYSVFRKSSRTLFHFSEYS